MHRKTIADVMPIQWTAFQDKFVKGAKELRTNTLCSLCSCNQRPSAPDAKILQVSVIWGCQLIREATEYASLKPTREAFSHFSIVPTRNY